MFYFLFFIAGLLISDTAYGMLSPASPQRVAEFPEVGNPFRRLFADISATDQEQQSQADVVLEQGPSEQERIEKSFRQVDKIINQPHDSIRWSSAISKLSYLIRRYSRLMPQQRQLLREAVAILQNAALRPPASYDPRIRRDVNRMPSLPEPEDNAGTVVND